MDALLIERAVGHSGSTVKRVRRESELTAALTEPADIILLDYAIPGFSGERAMQVCRETQPNTPVILISGTIGNREAIAAIKGGAKTYVLKHDLDRLPMEIDAAIEESRNQAKIRETRKQLAVMERFANAGAIAASAAHDLNNILTIVLSAVPLLERYVASTDGRRILGSLMKAAQRGAETVEQMLAITRSTAAGRPSLVDPAELVKDILAFLRGFPETIELREGIQLPLAKIRGDSRQLHNALLNLCFNARHAIRDHGFILVSAREVQLRDFKPFASPDTFSGRFILIGVQDDGCGMDTEILGAIFQPFFTTKPNGNGLGLTSVLRVADAHGGFVDVQSLTGQGSTFTLGLPVADTPKALPVPEIFDGHGKSLLLVDDEDGLLELLRVHLEALNYRVRTAGNGAEALSILRQQPIEILVTDLNMVCISGAELIARAKELQPGIKSVCMTGLRHAAAAALDGAHADATIAKPFAIDTLAKLLREL